MSQVTYLNTDHYQRNPPLKVRQDQLHVFAPLPGFSTTKSSSHSFKPRLFHYVDSPPILPPASLDRLTDLLLTTPHDLPHKPRLMCLDPHHSISECNNNTSFTEVQDARLRKVISTSVANAFSPSGSYIASVQAGSDEIIVYRTADKEIQSIKGVQRYEQNENGVQVYINDTASIVIVRQQEQMWMWTQSKEQYYAKKQEKKTEEKVSLMRRLQINTGMFRQSSYERKSNTGNLEGAPKQANESIEPHQLKGSWIRVLLKDIAAPHNRRQQQAIAEALDLKFDSEKNQNLLSDQVRIFQVKLFSKYEYLGTRSTTKQYDEDMILELVSQQIKVNNVSRGGNAYEACIQSSSLKSKISNVEFVSGQTKSDIILTKLDSSSQMAFIVLNSPHMVYCQALFASFDTSVSVIIKLFDFVKPDDSPSFDNRGKTNLCVDDAAWTKNDAFVVLIFNSFTFAILPRLGNSLIAIFNPTITNISMKTVDLCQHYKIPRIFNELILPQQVIQKHSQIKQNILATRKLIIMHSKEESFLVTDGNQVCYSFQMDFEPELSELFGKANMSYFFVRFCISLERLVVDPEILEKIPQMLTNKLPLFEFDKNAELDQEEDPGQIILTASQINPYEHGQKHMETNQSFNAEFKLDCQVVLLNLKHLLMSMRWNKSSPINYFQWIITVVNDCFFYFLKNSEPVYAYHALRIGEAYCKKILFKNEEEGESNKDDIEFHSERTDFNDFNQLKKFFLPVRDMYDYHNTKDYMKKSTAEKLEISYSIQTHLPASLLAGNGSWRFQFTKNYTLLVFYSLIQFRNYQAANFNILFLVFACYILQRYLDNMFNYHLKRVIEIVYRNFQLKKKSDDYELFLGKSGKNMILGPPIRQKAYQDWTNQVMKISQEHFAKVMGDSETAEIVVDTCVASLRGQNDTVAKNAGYMEWLGQAVKVVEAIEQASSGARSIDDACNMIRSISIETSKVAEGSLEQRQLDFSINSCLYILTETQKRSLLDKTSKTLSLPSFIISLQSMLISTQTQLLSTHIKSLSSIFDPFFQSHHSPATTLSSFLSLTDPHELRELLSILYLHFNDLNKSCAVLSSDNLLLFKLLLLSSVIKNTVRQLDILLPIKEEKTTREGCQRQQMKQVCVATIRRALGIIKITFGKIYKEQEIGKAEIYSNISAAFQCLPSNSINVLREELFHQAVESLSKLLKFTNLHNKAQKKADSHFIIQEDLTLPQLFLVKLVQKDNSSLSQQQILPLLDSLLSNSKLTSVFYHYLHLALLCLSYDSPQLADPICIIRNIDSEFMVFLSDSDQLQPHPSTSLSNLMFHSFVDLSLILGSVTCAINLAHLQAQNEEAHQMGIISALVNLATFDEYQPAQGLLSQAMDRVKAMIARREEIEEEEVAKAIKLIKYGEMNRSNKQKMASLMEQVRNHPKQMPELMQTIENVMFSTEDDHQNFFISTKEIQIKFISVFNSCEEVKKARDQGVMLVKNLRMRLLERCSKIREKLGVSFDYSYIFDHSAFQRRTSGHILGVTDSIIDKYKQISEKRNEMKIKQRAVAEKAISQPAPLSFREGNEEEKYEPKNESKHGQISLDSARQYGPLLESPRAAHQKTPSQVHIRKKSASGLAAPIPIDPIQFGVPHSEIARNLMRSRQLGNPSTPSRHDIDAYIINKDFKKLTGKYIYIEQEDSKNKKESSAEPVINFINVASIQNDSTKRKNSVRRHIGGSSALPQVPKPTEYSAPLEKKPIERPQHRKGQMSMAVNNDKVSFNFGNQKHIGINPKEVQKSTSHPPGLPKAAQAKKARGIQTKSDIIFRLLETYEKQKVRQCFSNWRYSIQKRIASPFNLMVVKKEGESYSVQELRDLLSKQKQIAPPSQEAAMISQPFEFLTMKDGKIQQINKPLSGTQVNKKQKMTKEQKLAMMKKFKSISDKLDKVQREADQLNKDFGRLNQ